MRYILEIFIMMEAYFSCQCPGYDGSGMDVVMVVINFVPVFVLVFFSVQLLPPFCYLFKPPTIYQAGMAAGLNLTYLYSWLAEFVIPDPSPGDAMCSNRTFGYSSASTAQAAFFLGFTILFHSVHSIHDSTTHLLVYFSALCIYPALVFVANVYLHLYTIYECLIGLMIGVISACIMFSFVNSVIFRKTHLPSLRNLILRHSDPTEAAGLK